MKILKFMGKGIVEMQEVAKPEPDDKHVVIKVMASALCGSELSFLKNGVSDNIFNIGHELVGIIEESPSNSKYKKGMRVGACVVQGCGDCEFCSSGYETACRNKSFYAANGHAEYFKLGLNGVRPIPDNIDWPSATILTGDGLGVPVRCSRRLGNTAGNKVLVIGLGPVGLSCVLVQAFKGAEVMGADISPYRIKLSKELGAIDSVDINNQDIVAKIKEWTDGRGADIVILAVGRNDALLSAADLVKQQGTIFQVSEFTQAQINPSAMFVQKEITMTGSWYYTSEDWKAMLALTKAGLPVSKLVTHVFPFEKAQEAFELFASGNSGKVVLTYQPIKAGRK